MLSTLSRRLNHEFQVIVILAVLALIWGSSFILMDKGLEAFNPFQIGAIRMIVATLSMLPFCLKYVRRIPSHKWKYFAMVGMIGNGIPAFLFPLAEKGINSATAGILNSLTPVFALIFGVFFGLTITKNKLIGVLIGLAGATCVTLGGSKGINGEVGHALIVVFATMLYGISVNIMKRYLNEVHPIAITGFSAFFVAIPYALYLFSSDFVGLLNTHPQGLSSLGYIALLGCMGTAASSVLFYHLVQITDAVRSSSVTYLMPIVALMWGFFRPEREDITLFQVLGMVVILAGVGIVNKPEKPK